MTVDQLGIEHQTVFGLPPVEFVNLAAELGCGYIAVGLSGGPYNPHGYEPYSLRDDAALRRRMLTAMHDRGVSISLGEGFNVRPGGDISDSAADLDTMAELGVRRISAVSLEPDLSRSLDEFGCSLRWPPRGGEGEFPLREILAVLPPDIVIGLEVPMRSRAEAGEPTHERARRCVRAARGLLAAVGTPGETAKRATGLASGPSASTMTGKGR